MTPSINKYLVYGPLCFIRFVNVPTGQGYARNGILIITLIHVDYLGKKTLKNQMLGKKKKT